MDKNQCFSLGKITKPHGLKGEMIIYLDVDNPNNYESLEAIFLEIKGELIPFLIKEIQIRGKKSIIKFEDINSIEQTEPYINADAWLPLKSLPKLKGNKFYYHEVIGYKIWDMNQNKEIGDLKSIYESTGNDLFAVDHSGTEILIPIVDQFIKNVDHESQSISLNLPDGLIDVFLNP